MIDWLIIFTPESSWSVWVCDGLVGSKNGGFGWGIRYLPHIFRKTWAETNQAREWLMDVFMHGLELCIWPWQTPCSLVCGHQPPAPRVPTSKGTGTGTSFVFYFWFADAQSRVFNCRLCRLNLRAQNSTGLMLRVGGVRLLCCSMFMYLITLHSSQSLIFFYARQQSALSLTPF